MTKQEFYDKLVAAAYDDTFPGGCVNEYGNFECLYTHRGDDGKEHRCAAGLLLPPDAPAVSGTVLSADMVFRPLLPEGMVIHDLFSVQCSHDYTAVHCHREKRPWDGDEFVTRINNLAFFHDVNKVPPGKVLSA